MIDIVALFHIRTACVSCCFVRAEPQLAVRSAWASHRFLEVSRGMSKRTCETSVTSGADADDDGHSSTFLRYIWVGSSVLVIATNCLLFTEVSTWVSLRRNSCLFCSLACQ